jgi:hypothetical protein
MAIDDGYTLEELEGLGEKAYVAVEMDGSSAVVNAVQGELLANMVIADSPNVDMNRECMIALVEGLFAVE